MTFFDVHLDTEGIIHNAIKSKIYLGRMMDSLYSAVIAITNAANTTEDVLRKYDAFFEILRKELEERGIERVEIGQAFDVTGCELAKTIELTPYGLVSCENGKREAIKLQDIFGDIFPPEHIIGRVVHAITGQHNKLVIDRLESDIIHVNELITGSSKRPENNDRS